MAANLMFGFDNDDEETFKRTYDFMARHRLMPNPYIITPYPGTRLYDRMLSEGRILHQDYHRYTSYQTVFRPKNFTAEKLDRLFHDFYKRMFSLSNIVGRFVHNLDRRHPWGSFMTQIAMMMNSLWVRRNVYRRVLPYY
ncbi:MAG: DUF4070 domain-containing protein [Deltaproteobacteria bacterium]|nr:DUF4070 domain-containing protein [Deltaproteobacteria bacterium]